MSGIRLQEFWGRSFSMMSFRGVGTIGLSNAEHILVEVLWTVTGFDGSVLPLRRQASLVYLLRVLSQPAHAHILWASEWSAVTTPHQVH